MGYRARIDNFVVRGSRLSLIKKVFLSRYKMDIKTVFQIRRGRNVYRVLLTNGRNIRLDKYKNPSTLKLKEFEYQKMAYKKGLNVANIIDFFSFKGSVWRLSEWIEGVRIGDVWNTPKMFEKCGEQIAKLNLIKDNESGKYLGLGDFTPLNLIWTEKEEVYIIDFYVYPRNVVDESIIKTLVMGIRSKPKAVSFLKGYRKFRSTDKIMQMLNENNWMWKESGFLKED